MEYEVNQNEVKCLIDVIGASFKNVKRKEPKQISPLVLAYIGDTIYDLFVRTMLVEGHDATAHGMHMMAAKRVCAAAQAHALYRIEPLLSEDEIAVFKRGRNAHLGTVPKNASITDYRAATGLEALLGFLYMSGNDDRIIELMTVALSGADDEQ